MGARAFLFCRTDINSTKIKIFKWKNNKPIGMIAYFVILMSFSLTHFFFFFKLPHRGACIITGNDKFFNAPYNQLFGVYIYICMMIVYETPQSLFSMKFFIVHWYIVIVYHIFSSWTILHTVNKSYYYYIDKWHIYCGTGCLLSFVTILYSQRYGNFILYCYNSGMVSSYYRPCRFERWYLRRRFYCVKHDKYPNNGFKDHFNKFINSQSFIWWMEKKMSFCSPLNSNEWTLSSLGTLNCWCLFGQYLKTKQKMV